MGDAAGSGSPVDIACQLLHSLASTVKDLETEFKEALESKPEDQKLPGSLLQMAMVKDDKTGSGPYLPPSSWQAAVEKMGSGRRIIKEVSVYLYELATRAEEKDVEEESALRTLAYVALGGNRARGGGKGEAAGESANVVHDETIEGCAIDPTRDDGKVQVDTVAASAAASAFIRDSVLKSEDLVDHILPYVNVEALAGAMQVCTLWKDIACADAHWEPRISAFLCLKQFCRPIARDADEGGNLWSLYGKIERSWRMFEDRAEPPSNGEGEYEHLSAWISILINEGDAGAPRIQRLGGKIQPFGDGSFLADVEIPFLEEETWLVTAEGTSPLEALRSLFTEGEHRELLIDLWLFNALNGECAMVARDWGITGVEPAEADIDEEGNEVHPARGDEFYIKNVADHCRVYANGEVHLVLHSTVTMRLLSTTTTTQSPSAQETQQQDEQQSATPDAAADLPTTTNTYTFRMCRAYLSTCLGLGSAENGVEEVELEHQDELVRSVLRLADWV